MRKRKRQSEEPTLFYINSGRDLLGLVNRIDDSYIARDVEGATVGTFATLQDAARAFARRDNEFKLAA